MAHTFEFKSTQLSLVSLLPKAADLGALLAELQASFGPQGESPDFFAGDGMLLDARGWPQAPTALELTALQQALKTCRLSWVGVTHASADLADWARQQGLWVVDAAELADAFAAPVPSPRPAAPEARPAAAPAAPSAQPQAASTAALVLDKPLRSGQKIYARGSDLVLRAMVNPGAEVLADGHIHVYAPLRGKAMAGASGNAQARIFTLQLEAELVSIAGVYRTSDVPWADAVRGRGAQIRLSDDGQERLLFESLAA